MKIQPRPYVSYLLRMWKAEEAGKLVWRASLENPHTGQLVYFASLLNLYLFLESGGSVQEDTNIPAKTGEAHSDLE